MAAGGRQAVADLMPNASVSLRACVYALAPFCLQSAPRRKCIVPKSGARLIENFMLAKQAFTFHITHGPAALSAPEARTLCRSEPGGALHHTSANARVPSVFA